VCYYVAFKTVTFYCAVVESGFPHNTASLIGWFVCGMESLCMFPYKCICYMKNTTLITDSPYVVGKMVYCTSTLLATVPLLYVYGSTIHHCKQISFIYISDA